ncbi:MAG: hypothetical protein KC776_34445 [Myxococcales bacterium]|nr:hypothetical protein [Myxococcales bacterium]MCB9581007.1 hypothetical protein [Polyangiaceae bacterium]
MADRSAIATHIRAIQSAAVEAAASVARLDTGDAANDTARLMCDVLGAVERASLELLDDLPSNVNTEVRHG